MPSVVENLVNKRKRNISKLRKVSFSDNVDDITPSKKKPFQQKAYIEPNASLEEKNDGSEDMESPYNNGMDNENVSGIENVEDEEEEEDKTNSLFDENDKDVSDFVQKLMPSLEKLESKTDMKIRQVLRKRILEEAINDEKSQ